MKKASIQLKYDEEKLSAFKNYMKNMCRRPSGNILKAGKHVKGGLA